MRIYRHLAWFFRLHWRTYSLALVMLFGVAVFSMAIPWVVGRAVDQMVGSFADPQQAKKQVSRH